VIIFLALRFPPDAACADAGADLEQRAGMVAGSALAGSRGSRGIRPCKDSARASPDRAVSFRRRNPRRSFPGITGDPTTRLLISQRVIGGCEKLVEPLEQPIDVVRLRHVQPLVLMQIPHLSGVLANSASILDMAPLALQNGGRTSTEALNEPISNRSFHYGGLQSS